MVMSKFTAPSPVLKCSWIQLKENGHIWSISLNEVGEEEAGLLMTLTQPCSGSLCCCHGGNLAGLVDKWRPRLKGEIHQMHVWYKTGK